MIALFLSVFLQMAAAEPPKMCGDDKDVITEDNIYKVAIIGNTRPINVTTDPAARRIGPSKGVTEALLKDISNKSPDCISFVGDMVRSGSKKEWKTFQKNQLGLIADIPIMPVVGDQEAIRDDKYANLINVFPDIGNDIGYNRVGSWYAYDVKTEGKTWRFMVLDANKTVLKSRWNEQLTWIDESVQGDYEGLFIFMHLPWYNLAGAEPQMNEGDAPRELIEYVEDSLGMMKLRAVFFGGGHANQVLTPNGQYGTLFVGAGGGGAPAEDLYLWQSGESAGIMDKVQLETEFENALLFQLDRWNAQTPLAPATMDKAFNKGSFDGFPGLIDGSDFPVQGYWELKVKGSQSVVVYHHYLQNGSIVKLYKMEYFENNGWKASKL